MGSQQDRIGLVPTLGFVLGSSGCCSGTATEKKENRYFDNAIEDCAKDGGEEFFTEMHCVL